MLLCGADARVRSRPPGRLFGFRWNFDKPGEGAPRGSGDPPHQLYAEVGKVCESRRERDRRNRGMHTELW